MRGAFETAGDIRSVDLLAALVALWRGKGSGSLRFSRPGATAGFDLAQGQVVGSLSSQAQFDTAAILIRGGKLDAAALDRLERREDADPALAAIKAGLVSEREWKWGQKIRAIEILSDVLAWLEGEYAYDAEAAAAAGDWALPIPRLLLELFLRSRDRTLVEHYLGPSDLPLLRTPDFEEEFETFGLTADAASVVGFIDGRSTAAEIAEKAPADEFAVLKLLAALTTLGLAHPAEAAPAAERSAAAPGRKRRRTETREVSPQPPPGLEPPPEPEPPKEIPETAPSLQTPGQQGTEPRFDSPEVLITGSPVEPDAAEAEEPVEEVEPAPVQLPVLPFEPAEAAPSDLVPEPLGIPLRREELQEPPLPDLRSDRPSSEEAAPVARRRRSGFLLAGLLAVLFIAVAVTVVLRARGVGGGESAAPPALQPTAEEAPVFPPAETAVPLPARSRAVRTPFSAAPAGRTSPSFSPSAPTPTAAPLAAATTNPPVLVATRFAPTPTKTFTRSPTQTVRTGTPTPTPSRPAPTKTLTPTPRRPPPTGTGTPVAPRPALTRTPAPAPAQPTRSPQTAPSPAAAGPGAEASRESWLRRAERDRQLLSSRRDVRYAIQLEIACEIPTLERAWAYDKPPGTLWLLTTAHRGRECFRVLWGRYGSLAQARAAKPRIPGFFVAPGNRPAVVGVR